MVRYRAAILGILLSIAVAALVQVVELQTAGQYIASEIPAPGPIALLFVAILVLSPVPRLVGRRCGFSEYELRLVYAMMLVAGPIGTAVGLGAMPFAVMGPYQHATAENRWAELLWPHIPPAFRSSAAQAAAFYMGGEGLGVPWLVWLAPLAAYGTFFALLLLLYFCLAALLRKEWEDHERLAYPLARIPLWLAQGADRHALPDVLRSPLFWIGFFPPLLAGSLSALHAMAPQIPEITRSVSLGPLFREPPLDILGIYGIRIGISFAIIGVAYLVPREVSFSVWCFFLAGCAVYVFGKAVGLSGGEFSSGLSRFPLFHQQRSGAFLALACTTLWLARRHLCTVARSVLPGGDPQDAAEPMPYRLAVGGLLLAAIGLVIWKAAAGANVFAAVCSVLFMAAVALAFSRIRAEVGLPAPGELPGFVETTTATFGSGVLSAQTRMAEAYTWFTQQIHNAPKPQPLAVIMEANRVGSTEQPHGRRALTLLMAWSMAVSAVVAVVLGLAMMYTFGAERLDWIRHQAGGAPFQSLVTDLGTERSPDAVGTVFTGAGAALFFAIWFLRTRFAFWPFHPIGYLIALDLWSLSGMWFSVFLGWLIRRLAQQYGGLRAYRFLLPAALGLIAGEMVARVFWSTLAALVGRGYIPI